VTVLSNQPTSSSVSIVSTFAETGLDERSWNALADRGTNFVFQTYQWNRSWLSAYGDQCEPLFVVVANGSSTVGVAPLVVEQTSTQGRVARFLGDGRSDYCDLLAANDWNTVAAMVRGLRDYGRWDVLDLKNVPAQSQSVEMIREICRAAGFPVIVRDHFVCPTLLIRGHEAAALKILNKPALRRRENSLERMGHLVCRDLTAASDVEPYLDRFFGQHITRWGSSSTPSLFCEASNRLFYRELTARLDRTGWLLFSVIELDEHPIAIHYGFDHQDSQFWYKPSFDPAFASKSPGLMLVRHLIRRAINQGRREFDFTVGDEPFKKRFTNFERKTVQIQVFKDPARYAFEHSKHKVISAMRRMAASLRRQL